MKTVNLKQSFSRLPISQRVEMIAPTLLNAILKFCTTNKVLNQKHIHLQDLSQICDLSAFKHTLDLTSKFRRADWTEQKQILSNSSKS